MFLLSLLQYQKQKILQESAGLSSTKSIVGHESEKEDSGNDSSNEQAVYDERIGEPCLVDQPSDSQEKEGANVALHRFKIKCLLKP